MHNFDNILGTQNDPLKVIKKPVKSGLKKVRNKVLLFAALGYIGGSIVFTTIFLISLLFK
jgi:hypothetical protein